MSATPLIMLAVWLLAIVSTQVDKTTIVPVPDLDGHVGEVVVSTEGGSQVLSEARQMTEVTSAQKTPSLASIVSNEQVAEMFAEALAVEPLPPNKFILFFLPDSTELTVESAALFPEILADIWHRESVDIGVHGHSDRVGSKDYNDNLSLGRAQAVQALLVQKGVDSSLIETSSHGEGNPTVPTADNVAEPRNRRVEVVVR